MPVDHRVVLFNTVGDEPAPAELLRSAGIEEPKGQNLGPRFCAVKLRLDDERLPVLLDALREAGVLALVRAERRYSDSELRSASWLQLALPYVGFETLPSQSFDLSSACGTCGCGAVPERPLAADLSKMGKKVIDHAAYGGHLVVTAALADVLRTHASGVRFEPVRQRSAIDTRYMWMEAERTLPPMEPSSIVERKLCPACGRSGHYDPYEVAIELHYSSKSFDGAADVMMMYERFGIWNVGGVRIGGSQVYVVSQKVRRLLTDAGVRRASFVPVTLL